MFGCIEFSWSSNYLVYPLLFSIAYCIRYYLYKQLSSTQNNPVLFTIVMGMGEMSSIIFEIITKYRSKRINIEREEVTLIINNEKEDYNVNNEPQMKPFTLKSQSFFTYFLLFICSLLDLFSMTGVNYLITSTNNNLSIILRISQILFFSILMYFFLNRSLYIHNILSMFIIFIGIIGLILLDTNGFEWIPILLYLCSYLLNSIRHVIFNYIIVKCYISPYIILFISGIVVILSVFSITLVSTIIGFSSFSFVVAIETPCIAIIGDYKAIISTFFIYFTGMLINTFLLLINQLLSPSHIGIGDTLCSLFLLIILIDKNDDKGKRVIQMGISCLIFIGCLIYTEIIIIKCFGMNRFTKKEIKKELLLIIK